MSNPLIVTCVEARNLSAMDKTGTSDPYIVLRATWSKQIFKTKVVKKSLTPVWDQTFTFYLEDCKGILTLKVWDKDKWSSDDYLGKCDIELDPFIHGDLVDAWYPLTDEPKKTFNKNKKVGPGEIHLKIHYATSHNASTKATSEHATPKQSIQELYTFGKVLGKGGFSVVKLATKKDDDHQFAVKIIDKEAGKDELSLMHREIDIMRKLKHNNIVQLYDVFDEPEHLFLVLEYVTGGELFEQIVSRGHYSEKDAANLIRQILDAVDYMHSNGVAHRDLKPENLLCSGKDNSEIKITDFGLSKSFSGEVTLQTACGTPDYVAPEVLLSKPYDCSVDIWSVGVITYILLCGFPPFYGKDNQEIFQKILSAKFDFPSPDWDDISEEAKNFIKDMLVLNPHDRPTAAECLAAPWIKGKAPNRSLSRLSSFKDQITEYNKTRGK
eukprot:TRINITY_DN807_c0_g4_i1.p1 TRINITY_DN807_c0_g4~~TRINITY_DN807_c0_g4_i1.p1  ORF type:complete len:439 (-),score=89.98 TRINITY_DN807_c0_g4_i1:106-1422(-)